MITHDDPIEMNEYRSPTDAELASTEFEAIWQAVKEWDISRYPVEHRLYHTATGSDVCRILDALTAGGLAVVPVEPTAEITKAMAESRAQSDEGEFWPLHDLLGLQGENETRLVIREAWRAGLAAATARQGQPAGEGEG